MIKFTYQVQSTQTGSIDDAPINVFADTQPSARAQARDIAREYHGPRFRLKLLGKQEVRAS